MVTSRVALEELLQNRLTTDICEDALRMQRDATDLFRLCEFIDGLEIIYLYYISCIALSSL